MVERPPLRTGLRGVPSGHLAHLVCPQCRRQLQYTDCQQEPLDGILECAEPHRYPVCHGVPILIIATWLPLLLNARELGAWRAVAGTTLEVRPDPAGDQVAQRLQNNYRNWSRQWRNYATEHTLWEEAATFREHIPLAAETLGRGQTVLEIGCGQGRNLQHLAGDGRLVVGLDLSEAAYAARQRYADRDDIIVVRADAHRLPLPDRHFDLLIADHALQHLEQPETCLREFRRVAKPGGRVGFNGYSEENNFVMTRIIEPLKRVWLRRLPVAVIDWLALLPAALLWLIIRLVYRPLQRRWPGGYRLLPLSEHLTFWFRFDFTMLHWTCFDLLHAPTVAYFSAAAVDELARKVGLNLALKKLLRQTLWVCVGSFADDPVQNEDRPASEGGACSAEPARRR